MRKTPPLFWQKKNVVSILLWPFSLLYILGRKTHRFLRLRKRYWASVPVISVGNITAGGAGKTPLVQALAKHFAKQGKLVAIISKGYNGTNRIPYQVQKDDSHTLVGDEPLMLCKSLANLPVQVWIGQNRKATVKKAEQAKANIIILDDGFQRDDISRTVDILVVDGKTIFGNGFCLPAGPLREPLSSIKRADFAVIINSPEEKTYVGVTGYRLKTQLEKTFVDSIKNTPLIAFAGIAYPEKFFSSLKDVKLDIIQKHYFPDHHNYTEKELTKLIKTAKKHKATLITTQKDMARISTNIANQITALPISLTGNDWENIIAELNKKMR